MLPWMAGAPASHTPVAHLLISASLSTCLVLMTKQAHTTTCDFFFSSSDTLLNLLSHFLNLLIVLRACATSELQLHSHSAAQPPPPDQHLCGSTCVPVTCASTSASTSQYNEPLLHPLLCHHLSLSHYLQTIHLSKPINSCKPSSCLGVLFGSKMPTYNL